MLMCANFMRFIAFEKRDDNDDDDDDDEAKDESFSGATSRFKSGLLRVPALCLKRKFDLTFDFNFVYKKRSCLNRIFNPLEVKLVYNPKSQVT